MSKQVFDGGEFLKQETIPMKFSNGVEVKIQDLYDEQFEYIDALEKKENPGTNDVRCALSGVLGLDAKALDGIGIRELRAAMDFLAKRLSE